MMDEKREEKPCLGRNSSESRSSSAAPAKTTLNLDYNAATLAKTPHVVNEEFHIIWKESSPFP